MRFALIVLFWTLPALAFGQSLGEVAKKERERREKNKREGRKVLVISESDIFPEEEDSSGDQADEAASSQARTPRPRSLPPPSSTYEDDEDHVDEDEEEDADVPDFIRPDLPMEQKLALFQRMKRHYERQVRQIDEQIAENERRLREIEAEIGETSALGGSGLPVAPRTGTGSATRPMTGQESATLVAEQNRLRAVNEQLQRRKEQLKLDLQNKGRRAGIPPGYLRF